MATAQEIIKQYTTDAPVNIEGMIEAFGIALDRNAELDPQIAGQIESLKQGGFKISVNASDHYYRRRFTMAHELAHFLLHRSLIKDGVDDTKAYRSLDIGKFNNQRITSQHEAEANGLAAKLLMPKKLVEAYLSEFEGDTQGLAKKFQVSKEAMGYRIQALGLNQLAHL